VGRVSCAARNRRNNAGIQRAVDRAGAAALPRALRGARGRPGELARLSGLRSWRITAAKLADGRRRIVGSPAYRRGAGVAKLGAWISI
jgi:hypothetical protein